MALELLGENKVPNGNGAGEGLISAIAAAVAAQMEKLAFMRTRLLSLEEAAIYLGMSPGSLRERAGVDVIIVRIDKRLRFDRRDLDRFVDRAPRQGV